MHWTLFMLFDDTALPSLDDDGCWSGTVSDGSGDSFGDLADQAYDAVFALLEDRIDPEDAAIKLIVSERYEHLAWAGGACLQRSGAWKEALDANLPSYLGTSASAVHAQLADGPESRAILERQWVEAAAAALTATADINLALHLLNGAQSIRRDLLPGARCFLQYVDEEGIYDCRRYLTDPRGQRPLGKLLLVKAELRQSG